MPSIGRISINPDDIEAKDWSEYRIESIKGKKALSTMQRGCDILEKVGVNYWISSGNLLGIYRDGKLIDHDTDIDVNVSADWNTLKANNFSKQILLGLTNNDFRLIRTIIYKNHFFQLAFIDNKTDVIFDVCFFYKKIKGGFAVHLCEQGYILKPTKFINKTKIFNYKGYDYPIPNHLKEFLTWKYGDWEKPRLKKVAWEDESPTLKRWR